MRVLVTGGAGFIGSHVLAHLLARQHTLCVLDNLSRGRAEAVPRAVPLHMADINDPHAAHIVADFAPDAVVHLAAQMDVRASVANPLQDAQVNVMGTVRMLQAAQAHGVHTFVLASSGGAIYGEAPRPTPESRPGAPMSPYGAAKACDEIYLETFARAGRMRGVSLRFANVYGPGQGGAGEAGVVAIFAQALLAGRTPTIFGDGLQSRDYVYVTDVAQAVGLALSTPAAAGPLNIGTGVSTDLLQLYRLLTAATAGGAPGVALLPSPTFAPARAGEVLRSGLDARRAHVLLGWRAETPLAQGLAHTVAALRAAAAKPEAGAPLQSASAAAIAAALPSAR